MLTGGARSATVVADEACQVLRLSRDALAPVIADDPSILETLSSTLAERRAHAETAVTEHAKNDSEREQIRTTLLGRMRRIFGLTDS